MEVQEAPNADYLRLMSSWGLGFRVGRPSYCGEVEFETLEICPELALHLLQVGRSFGGSISPHYREEYLLRLMEVVH